MVYKRKRKNLIWIAVILLVVVLLNFSVYKATPLLQISRNIVVRIIYPFQYAAKATYNGIRGFFVNVALLRVAQKENRELKSELQLYQAKLRSFDELIKDNATLRGYLKYKAESVFGYRLLHAEIISRSASNWFSSVQINRGEADGIKKDMAVVAADGLVGRVTEVSKSSSKVLLITDTSSSVSAVNQRSRHMGIVIGGSIGPLSMKYVSTSADMKPGDIVVTSGMSEVFPRGLAIGRVISVSKKDYDLFQKVTLSPEVKFSSLESVFVIVK